MGLRSRLEALRRSGGLRVIGREVKAYLEASAIMRQYDGEAIFFERVSGSEYPMATGIAGSRRSLAVALGVEEGHLLEKLAAAMENPLPPPLVSDPPCQEVVEREVDLGKLPILTQTPQDAGPYITAGILIIKDPDYGRNAAVHRLLQVGPKELVARLVEERGTRIAWEKSPGDLEVAISIGNDIPLLLAVAMSPAKGVDELAIANALAPTALARCLSVDLEVPAASEFVLEGRITKRLAPEGPFPDATDTMDALVRREPIIEIDCITHRKDPIFQAILGGGSEHQHLMGVPREPSIFREVNQVCPCKGVFLTPGGATWLHAVVKVEKVHPEDGKRAIEAAFRGHPSLKCVVVVDADIDIRDPREVEWAIATRFQADRDLVLLEDQPGSSIDPSAQHIPGAKSHTAKLGLDATIPWTDASGQPRSLDALADFKRVSYPDIQA